MVRSFLPARMFQFKLKRKTSVRPLHFEIFCLFSLFESSAEVFHYSRLVWETRWECYLLHICLFVHYYYFLSFFDFLSVSLSFQFTWDNSCYLLVGVRQNSLSNSIIHFILTAHLLSSTYRTFKLVKLTNIVTKKRRKKNTRLHKTHSSDELLDHFNCNQCSCCRNGNWSDGK